MAVRGPKKDKKKAGGDKVAVSNAIINIYKDGEDAMVYPSDVYPPWVMGMLKETYDVDDVVL